MAQVKLKSLRIKGLRGVKEEMTIPLDQKSMVLYGDNGSGKSSITDSLEWFYYSKIRHLSTEEIGKAGIEALRNISLPDNVEGILQAEYSNADLNCSKNVEIKKGNLKYDYSNKTTSFQTYLKTSQKENLFIRYRELVNFILSTKTEKLADLSEIIGFADITNTKTVLKKALNDLAKEQKTKNYEGAINSQQANLFKQVGQNITSENHFINALNKLIVPLKLLSNIKTLADIDIIISAIKKPTDNIIIEKQSMFTGIKDFSVSLMSKIDSIDRTYKDYETQFNKLAADVESLKKLFLSHLLDAGKQLLVEGHHADSSCPLCLQSKDIQDLLKELEQRSEEIKKVRAVQKTLSDLRSQLNTIINENIQEINGLLKNKYLSDVDITDLKAKLEAVKTVLSKYAMETAVEIATGNELKTSTEIKLRSTLLIDIETICNQKYGLLTSQIKDDKTTDIVVKIEMARSAYQQMMTLKREQELIERQRASFEIIYADFVKKQKDSLASFITNFSGAINEYYQFMNPDEAIKDIKLLPVEHEDELLGLTICFNLLDCEVSPPHKYFSESHLNCFGIAFFLASVKAFNKENKFIVMDDVISSFDANHRKRFADLLIEKFSDYQIILMTHEKQWFDYVKSIIQNKNWLTNEIKWSDAKGTYLEKNSASLRQRIEYKVTNTIEDDLGNNIRKYLENMLKNIAYNLKVKLEFQFNETNENRMSYELLSALKGKVAQSCVDCAVHLPLLDRTLASTFIGNKDSHDSTFNPSMGDLKAFWKDVKDIEGLFYCNSCQKYVALRYYDEGSKNVKCKCGAKEYSWKK